jgi:hypothetical protein
MITLARASSNCKRQTHRLVREDIHKDYDSNGSAEKKKMLAVSLKGLVAKRN